MNRVGVGLIQTGVLLSLTGVVLALPVAQPAEHNPVPRTATQAEQLQWQRDHLAYVIEQQKAVTR